MPQWKIRGVAEDNVKQSTEVEFTMCMLIVNKACNNVHCSVH